MQVRQVIYVYPDIALAVSLLMNALILWGTARICSPETRWPRLLGAALAGALYSMAAAFPQMNWLMGFWVKMAASVLMFALAFAPLNLKRFFSAMAVFYIISFALGGLFLGVLFFLQSSRYYPEFSNVSRLVSGYFWPGLLMTVLIFVLLTGNAGRLVRRRVAQNLFKVPVSVGFGGSAAEVVGLIDTGNQLMEPLSGTPVVIIEYEAVKGLFPQSLQAVLDSSRDPDLALVLESLRDTPWVTRFRLIPFHSIGQEHGLLMGFRPDWIEVSQAAKTIRIQNVVVGVYRQQLSSEGSYRALLHPAVIEGLTA